MRSQPGEGVGARDEESAPPQPPHGPPSVGGEGEKGGAA